MTKPIFFIQIPKGDAEFLDKIEAEKSLDGLRDKLRGIENDYHILIDTGYIGENVSIQVFFEKDFNSVKYDELKSIVENAVKK